MDLNSAELFIRVVQKGSFSAASRHTGIPVATVSRRISELEKSLGVRLLERSTRQLRLTGAGSTLFDFVSRGVLEIDAGVLALQDRESELKGTLRLSMPPSFEPWWALLKNFQEKYPQIELDIYATDRKIDLIEDGIDVSLRIGDVVHLSAIARKLLDYQHVLVATPEFIESFGQPESPQDLINFPCAVWGKKEETVEWNLGQELINIQAIVRVNDYLQLRYLVLQHTCITELPPFMANTLIKNNKLVHLLPEFEFPKFRINLIYQSRHQLSRIARVYIDYCVSNADQYLRSAD